ncbi:hypothetical protein A9R00_05485 [Oleispira antarctica]|uniref:DUF3108 domain-containing protein n=1 Tax=Oleispira antarctica TaxID=188908 RepID=A0A1Y5HXN8_OLEAN|nr:hypothetical protein A9R00_05485 [Oleispira antarctica]
MDFISKRINAIFTVTLLTFSALTFSHISTANDAPYPAFTADYQAQWKGGWFPITVDAKRTLTYNEKGEGELRFAADSAIAGLDEISNFRWQDERIQPLQYRYIRTGLFQESERDQRFDWQQQKVTDGITKKVYEGHWHDQIQDNLSYSLQASIDLRNGKTRFTYPVFYHKKIRMYDFQLIGFEALNTPVGTLRTIKVEWSEKDKKKTYLWFAKDYDYLLVRIKQKQKDGQSYQINLTGANINGKTLTKLKK